MKVILLILALFFVSSSWGQLCKEHNSKNFAQTPRQLSFGDQIIVSADLNLDKFKSDTAVTLVPLEDRWGYRWVLDPTRRTYKIRESFPSGWSCQITVDQGTPVLKKGIYSKTDIITSAFDVFDNGNGPRFGYIGRFNSQNNAYINCLQENENLFRRDDKTLSKESEVISIFNEVKSLLSFQANIKIRHCDTRALFQNSSFEDNYNDEYQWINDPSVPYPRGNFVSYSSRSSMQAPQTDGRGSLTAFINTLPDSVKKKLDLKGFFADSILGNTLTDCRNGIHYCQTYKFQEYYQFDIGTDPKFFFKINQWRLDPTKKYIIVKYNETTSNNYRNQHNLNILATQFNSWNFNFGTGYSLDCSKRLCIRTQEIGKGWTSYPASQ